MGWMSEELFELEKSARKKPKVKGNEELYWWWAFLSAPFIGMLIGLLLRAISASH